MLEMSYKDIDGYSDDSFDEYTDDEFEESNERIHSSPHNDKEIFDGKKSVACQKNIEFRGKRSTSLQTQKIETKDQILQCTDGDDDTEFLSILDACRAGQLDELSADEQHDYSSVPCSFLRNALSVCGVLIEENSARFQGEQELHRACSVDDNCWVDACSEQIKLLLKGKRVIQVLSANSKGPLFITVHSPIDAESCSEISKKTIICLWRESSDVKLCHLLVFEGCPTVARFLQNRGVICAAEDGSMHVWNLSSSKILDSVEKISSSALFARAVQPTVSTGWDISSLGSKHLHMSPIVGLEIVPDTSSAGTILSQIISIDVEGELIIWLLSQKNSETCQCIAGMQQIMTLHQTKGLSLKVVSDVGRPLYSIEEMQHRNSMFDQLESRLQGKRVLGVYLFPNSRNTCLVPLSDGHIVECRLAGGGPVKYYSKYSSWRTSLPRAESINFNPFIPDFFLVGWSDGSVSFFRDTCLFPLRTFEPEYFRPSDTSDAVNIITNSQLGAKVKWSTYNPTTFFVSLNQCIASLDLARDDLDLNWKFFDSKSTACTHLAAENCSDFAVTSSSDFVQNPRILVASGTDVMVRKLPKSSISRNTQDNIKKGLMFLKRYANSAVG